MRTLKTLSFSILMLLVMASFSQCSSSKQLQKNAPVEIEQVYFQKWVGGIEGGGSGLNLMIPVKSMEVQLDSAYFRGRGVKLESRGTDLIYIGRFDSNFNKKKDMVMSSDPKAEYGNKAPEIPQKIPFELEDDECIVSFMDGVTTKYFKVENVVEKEMIAYPSPPPNKQ